MPKFWMPWPSRAPPTIVLPSALTPVANPPPRSITPVVGIQ
jgi:hypothetical protein